MTIIWPIVRPADGTPGLDALDATRRAAAEAAAVDYLHRWTWGAYGLRAATVRPCWTAFTLPARRTVPWSTPLVTHSWNPILVGGRWYNLACGCGDSCRPGYPDSIRFPFWVQTVEAVWIGNTQLPSTAYKLETHSILHRIDGQPWPDRQDFQAQPRTEGAWTVELTYGRPVPEGGQIAAGALAEQIARAMAGADNCQLPQRVQTITRQGVTVGMLDSMEGLEGGKTGIWLVDSWVSSITRAPMPPVVRSVDVPQVRFEP